MLTADRVVGGNEAIEIDKAIYDIRQETYSLPQGFHWETLDINNPMVVCIIALTSVRVIMIKVTFAMLSLGYYDQGHICYAEP